MDTSIVIRVLSVVVFLSLIYISASLAVVPVPPGAGRSFFPFPHTELPEINFSVFPDWDPIETNTHFMHYAPPEIGISEIPDYRVPDVEISFSDYHRPDIDISYMDYHPPDVGISFFDYKPPAIGISENPTYRRPDIGISELPHFIGLGFEVKDLFPFS